MNTFKIEDEAGFNTEVSFDMGDRLVKMGIVLACDICSNLHIAPHFDWEDIETFQKVFNRKLPDSKLPNDTQDIMRPQDTLKCYDPYYSCRG
jgi:hypothetical protein